MENREYYQIDQVADQHFWYLGTRDLLNRLIKRYALNDTLKILDAGCGPGAIISELKKLGQVSAIDLSPVALNLCQRHKVFIKQGGVEKIPFKDESFDVVICTEVLYHQKVKNPLLAVEEFKRVCRPGGIIIVREPAFNYLTRHHDRVVMTGRRFNINSFNDALDGEEIKVLKKTYSNLWIFPIILTKKIMETFFKDEEAKSDVQSVPMLLNNIFIAFIKVENFLLKWFNLPVGSSVLVVFKKI